MAHSNKNNQARRLQLGSLAELLVALFALVTLLFEIWPQLNPWNSNYLEMANAGDIDSQIFLAQQSYEAHDYQESKYWYSLAANKSGNQAAKALNNLAYIKLLLAQQDETAIDYDAVLSAFLKAGEKGEITGYQNALVMLLSNSPETFPSVSDCEELQRRLTEILVENNAYEHDLFCMFDLEWKHPTSFTRMEPLIATDTDTDKYILIGSGRIGGLPIYTYQHYERKDDVISDYTYISPSG